MRWFFVMSSGLLLGCATAPVQQTDVVGNFVDLGAARFVVFTEDDKAVAVTLGPVQAPTADWLLPAAQQAIEQATGCPVVRDSLVQDAKTIAAQLACAQSTSIFIRARTATRGRTARSGHGPTAQQLAEFRTQSVAEEQRKLFVKQ